MQNKPPAIECRPIRWRIMDQWFPEYGVACGEIDVEERQQRDGIVLYAVTMRSNWELSHDGDWDRAPIPSERDEWYIAEHRWHVFELAVEDAQAAARRDIQNVPGFMRQQ